MSDQLNPSSELRQLRRRLAASEERSARPAFATYVGCYSVLAGLAVALTFVPMPDDVTTTTGSGTSLHYEFGTLWEMADGGDVPGQALLLILGLACLLVVAACRPTLTSAVPISVVVVAGMLVLALLDKLGTGDVEPPLSDGGRVALACFVLTALLAAAHTAQLLAWRRGGATKGRGSRGPNER